MKNFNKNISEKTGQLVSLLKEGRVNEADAVKMEIDKMYLDKRAEQEEKKNYLESKNFGLSNYIFEEKLPYLFKHNKPAMKEYVNTVKSDKNLVAEALFYNALKKYDGSDDARQYVKECLSLASEKINPYTVVDSHRKIATIMAKYDIKPDLVISEEKKQMFEDCNYLLTKKKNLTNITTISNKIKSVGNYINENRSVDISENENAIAEVEKFENKYAGSLTESEKEILRVLTDTKNGETKQKMVFNKFKNECLSKIDNLIQESQDDDKASMNAIKEEVENKVYNPKTAISDVIKLIEISDIVES